MRLISWAAIVMSSMVFAAPLNTSELEEWDARITEIAPVNTLSGTSVSELRPYTEMARIAYCPKETIESWTCGEACQTVADFKLYTVGGDGKGTPVFFVGYHPALDSVVVAHEGTDPKQLESLLVDANIVFDPLNTTLYPGINPSIKAHDGFTNAHDRSALQILQAVQRGMVENKTKNVALVGHSLGGALALLNGVYLQLNLPPSTVFKIVTFGQPRVGNQEFADYVDRKFGRSYTRITNSRDLVPIIPGIFLGFHHTATNSEIHFDKSTNNWTACAVIPTI
ncbi:hypothetical protein FRC02_007947 [Tulasnella sp. 418]|nr:hypothetical protein FRC02_007947 [Tulasnella sp. 418]